MQLEYNLRLAEKEDAPCILDFLVEHFAPQEPSSKALKLTTTQLRPLYAPLIDRCLQFPFSTIVTLESGKIIAVLLNSIWRRDDEDGEGADYDAAGDTSENLQMFVDLLNKCHEGFWSLVPSTVNTVLHREVSCVAPQWQRRGIATKMVTANMSRSRIAEHGVDGVISETSSLSNQTLLHKNGFKCLKEIPYSDIVDSEGNQILKTHDGSVGLQLNMKLIENFKLDD